MANYKIIIDGVVETDELYIIGFERALNIVDLPKISLEDFSKLNSYVKKGVKPAGSNMTVYKFFNESSGDAYVINALSVIPTEECIEILSEQQGTWAVIPPLYTVLKVTLQGSYDHLMEAWQQAFAFIKENNLICDAYLSPWESYVLMGEQDSKDNYVTEIFIPLIPLDED